MFTKDAFGRIEYRVGSFFIPYERGDDGNYHILQRRPFMVTDVYIYPFGDKTPSFESFAQAVNYLKANYKYLM